MGSVRACATNIRSKGFLCSGGSVATRAACSPVMGSKLKPAGSRPASTACGYNIGFLYWRGKGLAPGRRSLPNKGFLTVLPYRSWLLLALGGLLLQVEANQFARAGELDAPASWQGEPVGRLRGQEQEQLSTELRAFFGQSESKAAIVSGVGPLLADQFRTVGEMDEYRLPDGQLMIDQSYGRARIDAVTVIKGAPGRARVLATAFLTHLCPKEGVEERFTTSKGVKYPEHFTCDLDYSLIILYAHGSIPDPEVDADLTKWAKATIEARVEFVIPDRKLVMKRFVRVLGDRPVAFDVPDGVFPRKPNPQDGMRAFEELDSPSRK
jgi:hypothetical protein